MATKVIYFPFVITVADQGSGNFQVSADFQGVTRTARGDIHHFTDKELKAGFRWDEAALIDPNFAVDLGQRLFQTLFPGDIGSLFRDAHSQLKPNEALRIVITLPLPPKMENLPWELLRDPYVTSTYLGRSIRTPVVRRFTDLPLARPAPSKGTLQILLAAASPAGFAPLDETGETTAILKALKRGKGWRGFGQLLRSIFHQPLEFPKRLNRFLTGKRFKVDIEPHTSRDNLEARFKRIRQGDQADPIHVVHLIGHGDFGNKQPVFYLEKNEQAEPVNAQELADLIGQEHVQLVFLNACESGVSRDGIDSMAHALLMSGVPAVIGMQMPVLDRVAIDFAREFYTAWAAGEPLEAAVTEARRWVRQTGRGTPVDWSIPALFVAQTGGWTLKPMQPAAPILRILRAIPKALVSLAAVISLLVSYLLVFPQNWVEARTVLPGLRCVYPAPMSSEHNFNLVVVPPTVAGEHKSNLRGSDRRALSDFLYQRIRQEFELIDLQIPYEIRPPSHTCTLSGETKAERQAAAKKLAESIGAHVVVYGLISQDEGSWRYSPEFYVSYKGFAQGEHVIGTHTLGQDLPINFPFQAEDYQGVQKIALTERIKALSLITIGMAHYFSDHPEEAIPLFELAEETQGWSPEDHSKAVISLFLGNALVADAMQDNSLTMLEAAKDQYDQALALKPGYARALSGQANILYLLGAGDFGGLEPDPELLAQARDRFESILQLADPEVVDIALNLHFTLGKIYMLQGQGSWDQARTEFALILDSYEENPDASLDELAGHTYARLGLLAYYEGDLPQAEAYFLEAVERVSPHYKASYLGTLSQIFAKHGDPERAVMLLTQAQDIATFYCEDENAEKYYQAIQILRLTSTPQE